MVAISNREALFVQELLKDWAPVAAARRTGYKNPAREAQRLLANPKVQAVLKAHQQTLIKRTDLSQDRIVEELRRIALADIGQIFEWGMREVSRDDKTGIVTFEAYATPFNSKDLPEEVRAAIQEVKIDGNKLTIKMHDKKDALRLLGLHFGMFPISGKVDHLHRAAPPRMEDDPDMNLMTEEELLMVEEIARRVQKRKRAPMIEQDPGGES